MADHLPARAAALADSREFGAWMIVEQRRVFLLCLRFLNDRDEADSATQDAFLKAFQALRRTGQPEIEDPSKWITRIAVNTCLDRLRSKKWQIWRRRPAPEDEIKLLGMTPELAPDAEERMFAGEIRKRLQDALVGLSDRQRAVFTLRHYEDLSLDEIADTLGLDVGTVKAHMFRAVSKLRVQLRDLYAGVTERDGVKQ
ncbi:MAG: RNA polymerase sigma factor [Bryobacteraceae bacterium]